MKGINKMGIETAILATIAIASIGSIIVQGAVNISNANKANDRNADYYKRLNDMLSSSPTYSNGPLYTQTNNCLATPIVYGEVKIAGNTIWQSDSSSNIMHRLIAFGVGEIKEFSEIKINDKAISSLNGCSYTAYLGTKEQTIDSRVPGATLEDKVKKVGGLKGVAYLAVTAQASAQLSGGFNLTAKVKGQKVKIYSNISTYSMDYSTNPIWCVLDFLTGYYGCQLKITDLDIQSFIESAQYCDELVNGKPRFVMNLILDEKRSRLEWIEAMLMSCRGYIAYQGGKLSVKIERVEDVMQAFTPNSIIAGSERFWTTPREKRADIFKVQYIDPENEYAKIYAVAEADVFENEQPIVQEAKIFSVTNFNQASRLAWFYLNQAKTCNKFISFRTSQEGLDRTVGDVIEITSTFLGYENKKMRIVHMSEAQEGQIDIACKEYNPDLYSDELGSAEPIVNAINLPSMFDNPQAIENLVLNEIGWQTAEGNHISTIKINWDKSDNQFVNYYNIEYKLDTDDTWTSAGTAFENTFTLNNIQVGKNYQVAVSSVTNRNITSERSIQFIEIVGKNNPPGEVKEFIVIQKGDYLKANILPPDDPDISYYEIRKGLTWEHSELVQTFLEKTTLFKPTEEGSISYLVKAVDNVGNYSTTAARTAVNVTGITPKNIIIEETFVPDSYISTTNTNEVLLPVMDMGVNFENYRDPKETGLNVTFASTNPIEVQYRAGYENYNGWNDLTLDTDNWAGNVTMTDWDTFRSNPALYDQPNLINWTAWKVLSNEPDFTGEYLQVKLVDKNNLTIENITQIAVKADIEDIEDKVLNINVSATKTTITLNKNFTTPPAITITTADTTGKACSWRVSNVKKHYFDIELLDKDDNLISGKIISAIARGY